MINVLQKFIEQYKEPSSTKEVFFENLAKVQNTVALLKQPRHDKYSSIN